MTSDGSDGQVCGECLHDHGCKCAGQANEPWYDEDFCCPCDIEGNTAEAFHKWVPVVIRRKAPIV